MDAIWATQQLELKKQHILEDQDNWISKKEPLKYIGGVDISFIKDNDVDACAAFIVLSYPDLKVVYEQYDMVQLTQPYIPGFLAFREVDHLVRLIDEQRQTKPELTPQVIFVDGNGLLHVRRFGLACHLGVLINIPTIGIGKNLFAVDGFDRKSVEKETEKRLKKPGDYFELKDSSNLVVGAAMLTGNSTKNPVFISIGHKVSLDTAIKLTKEISKFRVPEPVRQADQRSREYLRNIGN